MQNKATITFLATFIAGILITSAVNYIPVVAQNDTNNAAFEINEALNNASVDQGGVTAEESQTPEFFEEGITPNVTETEQFEDLGVIVTVTSGEPAAEDVPTESGNESAEQLPPVNDTVVPPVEELPSAENITEDAPVMDAPAPVPEPAPDAPVMATPEATPEEELVVNGSENAGAEIVEAVPDDVKEEVEQAVNDTVEVIEGSVNGTADPEVIEDAAGNLTETVGDVPEAETGLEKLLVGLVDAQEYNENLTEDEKTSLQDNLEKAIEEI